MDFKIVLFDTSRGGLVGCIFDVSPRWGCRAGVEGMVERVERVIACERPPASVLSYELDTSRA